MDAGGVCEAVESLPNPDKEGAAADADWEARFGCADGRWPAYAGLAGSIRSPPAGGPCNECALE